MILKKIIIKDQKELYRHKNYLLGLDLEFNSTKKEYSNSSEINFDNLFELTEFLKNHNFTYSIVEEKITDFKKQILAKYKTLQIDIDKEIPASMYKAVAEIFAFIYDLSNKNKDKR